MAETIISDDIIFTKSHINNQNNCSNKYNISGVANPSSKMLSNFFSYYFKDYSINKINKGSEFDMWAFVAHKDNKIIGAIKGDIMWNVVHIDLLMIHPDYRKEGIGSKLYNLAIEHGRKAKCTMATVETFNFQAPKYWESKGFTLDFKRDGYGPENILYFYSQKLF
jgi:ribosomal protein S18 acetylase RimI-like enzyme